jgi:hypothetical protein
VKPGGKKQKQLKKPVQINTSSSVECGARHFAVLLFWFNSAHPGYLDSQDTFYAGTIKGVGRFYQQTFIDTYSKWPKPNSTKLGQAPYQQDMHYSCRSAQRPVPPFFAEQTRVLSTAGSPKPTITSSTLRSTTSSTHKPRQIIRRLTAFLRHSFNDCNSGLNTPWRACRQNRQPDTVHHGIWSR